MKTTVLRVSRALVWLVYAWVAVTLVLLFFAFILLLFGANPDAGFVQWVYRSVERAMAPFRGIFEPIVFSDQSVLDISVLFAMIVYAVVALALSTAVQWLTRRLHIAEHQEQLAQAAGPASAGSSAASGPGLVVQLQGPTGVTASAVLTPYPWGTSIDLTASGLDPSRTYGLWLESFNGGRASAGTFQPVGTGPVRLSLTTSASLAGSRVVGITQLATLGEGSGTDVLATRLQ